MCIGIGGGVADIDSLSFHVVMTCDMTHIHSVSFRTLFAAIHSNIHVYIATDILFS